MKNLVPFLWIFAGIFGVPFLVIAITDSYGTFSISFAINVAILALPQLVWTFISQFGISRPAYIGGLAAVDAFLIFTVFWYFTVITKNDPYNEGFAFMTGFFYLPYSLVAIPVGALVGWGIGRLFRSTPR